MIGCLRKATLVSAMALAVLSSGVRADDIPLVTGEHWTKSSDEQKKAYLIGMANLAHVELAYGGTTPTADAQSIIPRMVKGLKGQTLDGVRDGLTRWYAANPQRLQRPVVETIWFEMVVPGLQKTN